MKRGLSFLSRWQAAIVGMGLLLYILMAVSATTQESNTFDEALHLTTGYLYWTHPEEKLGPDNGVFAQAWAALPLLADHLNFSQSALYPSKNLAGWEQGHDFFYVMGNDPAQMLVQGRTMIALLGAALGALIFWWSRELFGLTGGLISLILYVFNPIMLSNGALVTTDMAAALGFSVATYGFWKVTHRVTAGTLLFSVLALCLLVLSKMSAFVLIPIFFLILLIRLFSRQPVVLHLIAAATWDDRLKRTAAWGVLVLVHLVAVIAVLWFAYNFKYFDEYGVATRLQDPAYVRADFSTALITALGSAHILPPTYVQGLCVVLHTTRLGGFLLGHYSSQGWWWWFPFAFLIKTPIATLLLFLLAGLAYGLWKAAPADPATDAGQASPRPGLYDLAPLLILGAVYGFALVTSGTNIGVRHMMPVYPVLFILAGANAFWWRRSRPLFRIGVLLLLLGTMIESLAVRPHYLAFFNQFVGGPRHGYRYLIDSSLDWGQDLPGLRKWLDKNVPDGRNAKVYLSYCGTADPEYYGIHSYRLPDPFGNGSPEPLPWAGGIYCISATLLQGGQWTSASDKLYQQLEKEKARWDATATDRAAHEALLKEKGESYWNSCLVADRQLKFLRLCCYLRQREPDDEVGYSILIYRLSDENLRLALEGSPAESREFLSK